MVVLLQLENRKMDLELHLQKILREEEIKWLQRSKEKDLLEGANDTKYFQLKASARRRKKKITGLHQDEGIIEGEENLMSYITDYYKDLFGPPNETNMVLNLGDVEQISSDDKSTLSEPFSLDEIKEVIFSMGHNKAPGPDGMPTEFYQTSWRLLSGISKPCHDFHSGNLPVERLNYGTITLLPKSADADKLQKYRPICLLNVCYKISTKLLTGRM